MNNLGEIMTVFSRLETVSFPVISADDGVSVNTWATRGEKKGVKSILIDLNLSSVTTDLNPLGDQRPDYVTVIDADGEAILQDVDTRLFYFTQGVPAFRLIHFETPVNIDLSSSYFIMPLRVNQNGYVNVIFGYA